MVINIFDLTDTHRIDESQLFSSNNIKIYQTDYTMIKQNTISF